MLQFRKTVKKQRTDLQKLEDKLWDIFSVFIRLRDTDKEGNGKCFTCRKIIHWSKGDAGHGIGRQHKAVKFSEINNHLQCKKCNGFEEGRKDVYKENVNKKYGPQTWEKLIIASHQRVDFSVPLLKNNIEYYTEQVRILKEQKGMI